MKAFTGAATALGSAVQRLLRGSFALLLLGAVLAAQPLSGQETPGQSAATDTLGLPAAGAAALPAPGTERAYWHVFLAFGIAWALLLGYVVLLNRRLGEAERDLARLSGSDR